MGVIAVCQIAVAQSSNEVLDQSIPGVLNQLTGARCLIGGSDCQDARLLLVVPLTDHGGACVWNCQRSLIAHNGHPPHVLASGGRQAELSQYPSCQLGEVHRTPSVDEEVVLLLDRDGCDPACNLCEFFACEKAGFVEVVAEAFAQRSVGGVHS